MSSTIGNNLLQSHKLPQCAAVEGCGLCALCLPKLLKWWGAVRRACVWPLREVPGGRWGEHSPFCQSHHPGCPETAGNRSPGSCKTHHPAEVLEEMRQGSLPQPWVPRSPAVGAKKAPFHLKRGVGNESPCPQAHSSRCGRGCDTVLSISSMAFPDYISFLTPLSRDSNFLVCGFSFAPLGRTVCASL